LSLRACSANCSARVFVGPYTTALGAGGRGLAPEGGGLGAPLPAPDGGRGGPLTPVGGLGGPLAPPGGGGGGLLAA